MPGLAPGSVDERLYTVKVASIQHTSALSPSAVSCFCFSVQTWCCARQGFNFGPLTCRHAGEKFYTWLSSWRWDLAVVPGENPRTSCLQRYNEDMAANAQRKIDACACDAIVTDCHVNAESAGAGDDENSGPFNVHNGVSVSQGHIFQFPFWPRLDSESHWWNAHDNYLPDTVSCATTLSVLYAVSRCRRPCLCNSSVTFEALRLRSTPFLPIRLSER